MDQSQHKRLIKGLVESDHKAFDEVYACFGKKVFAFAFKNLKCREEANELVQEVFLQLWKGRSRLKEVSNMDAWIFKITFNLVRKRFRALATERKQLRSYAEMNEDTTRVDVKEEEYRELIDRTNEMIETMPPRLKAVFKMSALEGLSKEEISQKLQITNKTVENQLSSAKARLKKTLTDGMTMLIIFLLIWVLL